MQNENGPELQACVAGYELMAIEDLRRMAPEHREVVLKLIASIVEEFDVELRIIH